MLLGQLQSQVSAFDPTEYSPAVTTYGQTFLRRLVNAVQNLNHFFLIRDVEIRDRMPSNLDSYSYALRNVPEYFLAWSESFVPRVGFILLHQINDSSDAAFDESTDLPNGFLTDLGTRVRA